MSGTRALSPLRRCLAALAAAAIGAALVSASRAPGQRQALADTRPNILIFLTDDQRGSDTMSVMPKTREIFANGGRTYSQAFTTTPLCCPSRATLMTGQYAHNHRVHDNESVGNLNYSIALQTQLRAAGYRTGYVGKYSPGWDLSKAPPGFDRYVIDEKVGTFTNLPVNDNGRLITYPGYVTDVQSRLALRTLDELQTSGRPWFLIVAPNAPHHMWTPAKQYANAPLPAWTPSPAITESDRSDKPPWLRKPGYSLQAIKALRAGQLRSLMSVDNLVAGVMRNVRDDTLSLYTSDNGFTWGDHRAGGDYNTPGNKRSPYTDPLRVPFFLRWPGHVQPGVVNRDIVLNVDIAATVFDATGVTPTQVLDGHSLLGRVVRDRAFFEFWRDPENPMIPTWRSIRSNALQYIEYYDDGGRLVFNEYYDLVRDPFELTNLLHDGNPSNPDVSALSAQLRTLATCRGGGCP